MINRDDYMNSMEKDWSLALNGTPQEPEFLVWQHALIKKINKRIISKSLLPWGL